MKPAYGTPVEVTWVDHSFHFGHHKVSRPNDGLTICTSLGYLIRQDENVVQIAQSFQPEPNEVLTLIAGCVTEVRPLKRKPKRSTLGPPR